MVKKLFLGDRGDFPGNFLHGHLHHAGNGDTFLQMALGEVHRHGGRIKTDRIGWKKEVYRLAVTVHVGAGA